MKRNAMWFDMKWMLYILRHYEAIQSGSGIHTHFEWLCKNWIVFFNKSHYSLSFALMVRHYVSSLLRAVVIRFIFRSDAMRHIIAFGTTNSHHHSNDADSRYIYIRILVSCYSIFIIIISIKDTQTFVPLRRESNNNNRNILIFFDRFFT